MSTQTEAEQQPVTLPSRRGKLIFSLLTLLLAGILALSYPWWQQFTQSQQELQQQVQFLRAQVTTLQTKLAALPSQVTPQISLATLEARFNELSEQQQRLQKHFTRLTHQVEQQPERDDDWKLMEIKYLLTIAHHRLQLEHDIDGALAALIAADKRLQGLNKTTLLPLRTRIFTDIQRLQELNRPDLVGSALRLTQYANQAEHLPLSQGLRQTKHGVTHSASTEEETSWLQKMKEELKSLVVIRYSSEADTHFLTPKQRDFVTQALHLKLEVARLFLLRRDTQNFKASIQAVRDWLKRYYDQNDQKVKIMQNDLASWQNLELNPSLPDISSLVNFLQNLLTVKVPILPPEPSTTSKPISPMSESQTITP